MWSASTCMPSSMAWTGNAAILDSMFDSTLGCAGSRCWTTTSARPDPGRNNGKRLSSAPMPPADAPMPTTGIELPLGRGEGSGSSSSGGLAVFFAICREVAPRCQICHGRLVGGREEAAEHSGVLVVFDGASLEPLGQHCVLSLALLLCHPPYQGGPLPVGPHHALQHPLDFAVLRRLGILGTGGVRDRAAVAQHRAVLELAQRAMALRAGERREL